MVNQEELAICRRREHSPSPGLVPLDYWAQCKWCGMWLRAHRTITEQEENPPEDQRDPMHRLREKYDLER